MRISRTAVAVALIGLLLAYGAAQSIGGLRAQAAPLPATEPAGLAQWSGAQRSGVAQLSSAPSSGTARAAKTPTRYKNCAARNRVHKNGVGRKGAVDKVGPRAKPVTKFRVDNALYLAQPKTLDRDRDGIACEKH
ncbi:hypothetical protein BJY21_003135 [Kineosphaera limosa]|uniref:Excalibur calcium-binding domain-containing protein n=1 Tax=Kineosphaera limosa NBRC 100340 TaxID=1184609 RepID=K6VIW7_9MICO|nr:excalibur calcium-binding domain-containing protein [Kineosphaera limosa]NYE01951.1 hypothetical protein [Kineosphaera limosa]GAB96178.1 hypothetical protein KILIM_032_00640 [Kineosphaera limosa NBRC 100340]